MPTTTTKLSHAFAAFSALVLVTGGARAETPSYVGTWASDLAQCKVPQDRPEAPLVLEENRFDQHETRCTFASADGADDEWKVKANCEIEGNREPYDFMLTVSGNTLTITDEAGTRDLLRCR